MNVIAAADKSCGIGFKGDLLYKIPEDMKYFRKMTLGKTVVLGQRTLLGFPGQKPLPQRENIILSDDMNFGCEGAVIVRSIEEALMEIKKRGPENVVIIGGGSIYRQFLPYCEIAYITKLKKSFEADTFIKNLDESADWELIGVGEPREFDGVAFSFDIYKRTPGAK